MGKRLVLVLAAATFAGACGLRSDPNAIDFAVDEPTEDTDAEGRLGTCANPYVLPAANIKLRGRLLDGGYSSAWCGGEGPEDVYMLVAPYDVDIQIVFDELETQFVPIVRVQENACGTTDVLPLVCADDPVTLPYHFFARAGQSYSIVIDSELATEGSYTFDIVYGWPPREQCPSVDPTIRLELGDAARLIGTLPAGQGRVSGACGGIGQEHVFPLVIAEAMVVRAWLTLQGQPQVLSLRGDCAAVSELDCGVQDGALRAFVESVLPAGEYFIAVDQVGVGGGRYELIVETASATPRSTPAPS